MKNKRLTKITDKLLDDSIPDAFWDFVIDEMRKTGRLIYCLSESVAQPAGSEFLRVK